LDKLLQARSPSGLHTAHRMLLLLLLLLSITSYGDCKELKTRNNNNKANKIYYDQTGPAGISRSIILSTIDMDRDRDGDGLTTSRGQK